MVATMASPAMKRLAAQAKRLEARRAIYEGDWQEIAEYIAPDKGVQDEPSDRTRLSRFSRLYDGTGIEDKNRLAASLSWILTNPQVAWFKFTTLDPSLRGSTVIEKYLERVRDLVRAVLALTETNFYNAISESYDELVTFGTALAYCGYTPAEGVRFMSRPLSECYVGEDSDGRITRVLRAWKSTAQEIVDEYPDEASAKIRKLVADGKGDTEVTVRHLVEKKEYGGGEYAHLRMAYASVHWADGDDEPMRIGGYDRMPFAVARWSKSSGSAYGVGPGHKGLADIKTLNAAVRTWLRTGQKIADPPILSPDDGIIGGEINTAPGGLTLISRDLIGDQRPGPLNTGANPQAADYIAGGLKQNVGRSFFEDVRSLPENDRMTAAEIYARQSSGLSVLSPFAYRVQSELLAPMVMCVLRALAKQRVLPEAPAELAGKAVVVEFINAMSSSQSSQRLVGTQRWLAEIITPLSALDPGVVDMVDAEGIARVAAMDLGATAEGMRSREDIDERRAQRAQADQSMAALAEGQAVASAARDAGAAVRDLAQAGRV